MFNRFNKPEVRYARRMARIRRWDAPLEGGWAHLKAYVNMLFVDHGIFRAIYLNRHKVTDRFWRAAQPSPRDIDAIARLGVRTVVNLRGGREYGSWPLERDACERNGITLAEFVVRSREAPSRETVLSAKKFFETLDYPVLVHCKSGADRAGFMAALFLLVHEGRPVEEAVRELSLRYGHFRFAKTGILDAFFELYRQEGAAAGLDFMTWVTTVYEPDKLRARFRPNFWSAFLVDRILHRE
ncbi:uncharacterized protein (TIGR01244 family) [Pseudochelatococcus lubricantis]|uniref:Uncharacterized protein (TIGR01244 family) n=1 Tax=Pseudochelatococcus lubricantis TaxID=1538102 RepID=A0ABX0V181_9HYPH|nr:uncharacterized protein (TIGR01244 family) [Pseudochelatococcus lubricantis]